MSAATSAIDDRPEALALVTNLKAALPDLQKLLDENSGHWGYEDPIYRLYHGSWKVEGIIQITGTIVKALQALAPERQLNDLFTKIVEDGILKHLAYHEDEEVGTRAIVEAFFHARFFLEMAVKYGKELETPPRSLPSGWAAFLCLYQLR